MPLNNLNAILVLLSGTKSSKLLRYVRQKVPFYFRSKSFPRAHGLRGFTTVFTVATGAITPRRSRLVFEEKLWSTRLDLHAARDSRSKSNRRDDNCLQMHVISPLSVEYPGVFATLIRFPVVPNSSFPSPHSFLPSFRWEPRLSPTFVFLSTYEWDTYPNKPSVPHLGDQALSSLVLSSVSSLPTASVKFDFPFTSSQAIRNSDQFHRQERTSHIPRLVGSPPSFPLTRHMRSSYTPVFVPQTLRLSLSRSFSPQ